MKPLFDSTHTPIQITRRGLSVWRGFLLAALAAALATAGENTVFDLPEKEPQHLQLLAQMDEAHKRHDYAAMEKACRQGINLGLSDALWWYNLACALALQGTTDEALAALDRAVANGFNDADFLRQDPDLAALQNAEGIRPVLERMKTAPDAPAAPRLLALPPTDDRTVMQTSSNTLWSLQTGLFQTFFRPSDTAATNRYQGPEAEAINAWLAQGTAGGTDGVIYENRDGQAFPFDTARYPGLLRIGYAPDVVTRKLNIGLPNTLFSLQGLDAPPPVIGHSSMGYLNSPYWRSQPRAVCNDPRQAVIQSLFLFGNQLHFYPAYGDYDLGSGDLFPANTPYAFAVSGANNAERPFVEAALAALAALRPETRATLTRSGLLMPTLQMLLRASQRGVRVREDYLTGMAHPAVFSAGQLDTARLVSTAHALTTNDLPPIVTLQVVSETETVPDRDYFDILRTEKLFDTPMAVARVFRGAAYTRTLLIRASCQRPDARLHWVVLRGDPARVTLTPCATNAALTTMTVAHHPPFFAPVADSRRRIATCRVDIGVIAETPAGYSAPSFVSVCFLGNERRVYSADGRILSIDYTRPQTEYTDPLLSYARHWKDTYQYDAANRMTGWVRTRGLTEERFTAYGHRVIAVDAKGRPSLAHVVRYLPRSVSINDTSTELPDLAQVDENIEVAYRYASDDDTVGAPDLANLTQAIQPPASEP